MGKELNHEITERKTPLAVLLRCSCGWYREISRRQNALARAAKVRAAIRARIGKRYIVKVAGKFQTVQQGGEMKLDLTARELRIVIAILEERIAGGVEDWADACGISTARADKELDVAIKVSEKMKGGGLTNGRDEREAA